MQTASFSSAQTTQAAESITYTATDTTDNVTVAQTVSVAFTAGVPQVTQSHRAGQPHLCACGRLTASTVTVKVADHNQNPVSGISITLTALNGSSVVSPTSGW